MGESEVVTNRCDKCAEPIADPKVGLCDRCADWEWDKVYDRNTDWGSDD